MKYLLTIILAFCHLRGSLLLSLNKQILEIWVSQYIEREDILQCLWSVLWMFLFSFNAQVFLSLRLLKACYPNWTFTHGHAIRDCYLNLSDRLACTTITEALNYNIAPTTFKRFTHNSHRRFKERSHIYKLSVR